MTWQKEILSCGVLVQCYTPWVAFPLVILGVGVMLTALGLNLLWWQEAEDSERRAIYWGLFL